MELALDILSWVLLAGGALFCVIGAVGMLRMPGFYERIHAAGLIDTMGLGMIMLGLALQAGLTLTTLKLMFIVVFVWLTSPASTHALVKAAYARNVPSTAPLLEEPDDAPEGEEAI